jgi:hypothetical protein
MSSSNIEQVTAWLNTWVDGFDFRRVGKDQNLGRDIVNKVVQQIADRGLNERRGVDGPWPANKPKYMAWKEKNYGTGETNSRTGQMLSQKSLYGHTTIESKQVTMIYGTNQPPDQAAFGSPDRKAVRARPKGDRHRKGFLCQRKRWPQFKGPVYRRRQEAVL